MSIEILPEQLLHIVASQRRILHECIRSMTYYRELSKIELHTDSARYIRNLLYQDSIIKWAMVFGNRNEFHHWKNSAEFAGLRFEYNTYDRDSILESSGFTDSQWTDYHQQICEVRNRVFAHTDGLSTLVELRLINPNLDGMFAISRSFYDWLLHLWNSAIAALPVKRFDDNKFTAPISDDEIEFNAQAIELTKTLL